MNGKLNQWSSTICMSWTLTVYYYADVDRRVVLFIFNPCFYFEFMIDMFEKKASLYSVQLISISQSSPFFVFLFKIVEFRSLLSEQKTNYSSHLMFFKIERRKISSQESTKIQCGNILNQEWICFLFNLLNLFLFSLNFSTLKKTTFIVNKSHEAKL